MLGMYGNGFLVFSLVPAYFLIRQTKASLAKVLSIVAGVVVIVAMLLPGLAVAWVKRQVAKPLHIVGVQLEFPPAGILPKVLDHALAKHPEGQIFVLSEYTLEGGIPDSLRNWCRDHNRYLVVGGKDIVTNHIYYNTAFVVGTNGDVVFKQAKCTPIQFFDDGLPAPN